MMLTKEPGRPGTVRVIFSLPCFRAGSISVVGDFNAWDTTSVAMQPGHHQWRAGMHLPAGCAYRFRYLVNGTRWFNDWDADCYIPNEAGGDDSVVVTLLPHEMSGVMVLCPYDGKPCPYALRVIRNAAKVHSPQKNETPHPLVVGRDALAGGEEPEELEELEDHSKQTGFAPGLKYAIPEARCRQQRYDCIGGKHDDDRTDDP